MSKNKTEPNIKNLPRELVEVSFVFVDPIKQGIDGLDVKIEGEGITFLGKTDKNGHALTKSDVKRESPIHVYIRKKSGVYELKWTVKPKKDVNVYTIRSPELHIESTTKKTAKEEAEEEIVIPKIMEGEVLTDSRIFGDLHPFLRGYRVITEIGKITKDFPSKKSTKNPENGETEVLIEHHYKVIKTENPKTVALNILGSRLNYPKSLTVSDSQYKSIAKELGCEEAAVRAIAKKETKGSAYYPNGLPAILFERHKFFKFTKPKTGTHPYSKFSDICNPSGGGYSAPKDWDLGDCAYQYGKLLKAAELDKDAAIMSCSWGAFQVLAEYYKEMGYKSPGQIMNQCLESIDGQIQLFIDFVKMKDRETSIIKHIKNKNWEKVAEAYNGKYYKPDYPSDLERFYNEFSGK